MARLRRAAHALLAGITKVWAFARKELLDVAHQPRLVLTLIVGPFVILALFGFGYQRDFGTIRVAVAVADDSPLRDELVGRIEDDSDSVELVRTTPDRNEALHLLRTGAADIALVAPSDPLESVRNSEQAVFELYHDALDPFEQTALEIVAVETIDAANRELLAEVVGRAQQEGDELEPMTARAREGVASLVDALEAGDEPRARLRRAEVARDIERIVDAVGPTESISRTIASRGPGEGEGLDARLEDVRDRLAGLELDRAGEPLTNDIEQLREMEGDLAQIEGLLADFRTVEPSIIVRPLGLDVDLVTSTDVGFTDFYAPGVFLLLAQHLAITLAGLSLVRERDLGAGEMFRIAPVGAIHLLVGKYMAFTVAVVLVASGLAALTVTVFDVPLAGSTIDVALMIVLVTLASIGIGFLISALSKSHAQAVNITMIILLLSIFLSGFFLGLAHLLPAVQAVSWLLPITHALEALRIVMLRGGPVPPTTWVFLASASVVLFGAAWALVRRSLTSS